MENTAGWELGSQAANREADPASDGRKLSPVVVVPCGQPGWFRQAVEIVRKKRQPGKEGEGGHQLLRKHILLHQRTKIRCKRSDQVSRSLHVSGFSLK